MLKRVILSEAPFFTKYSVPQNNGKVNRKNAFFDTEISESEIVVYKGDVAGLRPA